ncbi:N-acetylmuramoyl-L-alanine amidase, partial [Nitrospinota bacterium]
IWAGGLAPVFAASPRVVAFRHFTTQGYTRVVLVLNRTSLHFRTGRLKNPPQIFVDIPSGRLKPGFQLPSFEKISLAQKLRVGRPNRKTLRLVIKLLHPNIRYRVFSLPDPDRIVIDLRETLPARKNAPSANKKMPKARPESRASFDPQKFFKADRGNRPTGRPGRPKSSLKNREATRRPLNLAARFRSGLGRIVLDPGHGGKDPGATGLYGLVEKKLVLDIARRVAAVLHKRLPPGNRIILSRNRDRFIQLEDRTSFANKNDADVFVSLHLNSSPIRSTRGIETYLLAEASTPRALALAARESGTTVSRLTDLQKILNDLILRSKVTESHQLATSVQNSMIAEIERKFSSPKSLGVKRGPFYVLVGATMPSILIEMAFVTNPQEARRLRTSKYRQALSEGIARGIANFVGVPYRRAHLSDGEGISRLAESGPHKAK